MGNWSSPCHPRRNWWDLGPASARPDPRAQRDPARGPRHPARRSPARPARDHADVGGWVSSPTAPRHRRRRRRPVSPRPGPGAPVRGCRVRALVPRREQVRPAPLVRHGDLRQPSQGRRPPRPGERRPLGGRAPLTAARPELLAAETAAALGEDPVAALAVGGGIGAEAVLGDGTDDRCAGGCGVLEVTIEIVHVDEG